MEKDLPKNWIETKLDKVVTSKKGKKPKTLMDTEFKNSVPYLDIRAFERNEIRRYADIPSSRIINENQIGIVWDGARSGWVTKGKYGAVGSTIAILNPIGVNENYLLKFLESKFDFLNTNTRGTGIPHVDPKILWDIDIPLPPLPEQFRIVVKLDRFFEQLEVIKASLEKIPVLLKNFRQQVLSQAVNGNLTEEWRKGKDLEEWKVELAKDCCKKVQSGGTPRGSEFSTSGIPFFKVYNIVGQHISFKYKPQFISEEIQKTQGKKSICNPGDVLMNIVGPPLNKVAIIPKEFEESNINQAITLFRPKHYLNNKFLYFFLREGTPVNKLVNETRGVVGQVNISLTQCREFKIPIPTAEEQEEIVKRIELLFHSADTVEKQFFSLKIKVKKLPKSILRKAFKGELVPQLESDGHARELLEEIERLRKAVGTKTKNGKPKIKKYETGDVELSRAAEGKRGV